MPAATNKRAKKVIRPVNRRRASRHMKIVRDVVREISGHSPYEKRIIELLKLGKERRALKFAKTRLGTHKRAMKKRAEMEHIIHRAAIRHH